MLEISEENKQVFLKQIESSRKAIDKYKNDSSQGGTAIFYRHVNILSEMRERFDIAMNSQKNLKELDKVLSEIRYF